MPLELSAGELLKEAALLFDTSENGLSKGAARAWRHGFRSAGEWMQQALTVMRGHPGFRGTLSFNRLGSIKYGLATVAFLTVLSAAIVLQSWALAAFAIPAFYLVEAQMVFLFPLAIDGAPRPFAESRTWTARAGGTITVMRIVIVLAARMLFGGFQRHGFIRSWCLGCLAVVIWYEKLRNEIRTKQRSALEIGTSQPLLIRKENLELFGTSDPIRILYASDLHFVGARSRPLALQLLDAAKIHSPHVILLGGDLVDHQGAHPFLRQIVRKLRAIAPVWAIGGNHDQSVGLNLVKSAVERGGGTWLEDGSQLLTCNGRSIWIDGAVKAISAGDGPRILCAHDPAIFDSANAAGYRLVFAGHLHGGQCVLTERNRKLYPAAWFYRWNGLRFDFPTSTMLVSRGLSDTLPIRWNCPREVILCEVY